MKKQLRVVAPIVLLLAVLSGCSEEAQQTTSAPEVVLGTDPVETILAIFGEQDRFARTEKLISVLRQIPADQTAVFEEALNGLEYPDREIDRLLVLTAWAKYDAPAATKWAKNSEPVDAVREAMFSESVYSWALKDHDSFLSDPEMAEYVQPEFGASVLRALIKGWFDSGAPGLESYVRDMDSESADRRLAVETLVGIKAERESAIAMVEWANAMEGDAQYKSFVNTCVATEIVLVDSKLAVDWCTEICDTELGTGMAMKMAASWVKESPEEAMEFINSRPDSAPSRIAVRSTYNRFVKGHKDRAFSWLEAKTEEERRKPMLGGPVGTYANRQSAVGKNLLALDWLEYLQDEESRESGQILITRRWLRKDKEAAEAWMAESSMSEDAQFEAHQSTARGPIRH